MSSRPNRIASFKQGITGLRDHKLGRANLNAITNLHVRFEETLRGQVFAKHAPRQIRISEFVAPKRVVFTRVRVDSFFRTAMHREVRLLVTLEVQAACAYSTIYGTLPNGSQYRASTPFDFTRESDIHRDNSQRHFLRTIVRLVQLYFQLREHTRKIR